MVRKNIVRGNVAFSLGGGLYHSDGYLVQNLIMQNQGYAAGALLAWNSALIESNIIFGNSASTEVCGVWLVGYDSNVSFNQNTVYANSAPSGPGMLTALDVTATNSIVWDNSPDQVDDTISASDITYSCVEGGYGGNLDDNPEFVSETLEGILFADHFVGEMLAPEWVTRDGAWVATGEILKPSNTGVYSTIGIDGTVGDVEVRFSAASFDVSSSSKRFRVFFRYGVVSLEDAWVQIRRDDAQLYERRGTSEVIELDSTSISTSSSVWMSFLIKAQGSHVEVWRGATPAGMVKILETDLAESLDSAQVDFNHLDGNDYRFDNVHIRSGQYNLDEFLQLDTGSLAIDTGNPELGDPMSLYRDFGDKVSPHDVPNLANDLQDEPSAKPADMGANEYPVVPNGVYWWKRF